MQTIHSRSTRIPLHIYFSGHFFRQHVSAPSVKPAAPLYIGKVFYPLKNSLGGYTWCELRSCQGSAQMAANTFQLRRCRFSTKLYVLVNITGEPHDQLLFQRIVPTYSQSMKHSSKLVLSVEVHADEGLRRRNSLRMHFFAFKVFFMFLVFFCFLVFARFLFL